MEIQIWSDFACPWCALGLARLDVALEQFEHADDVAQVHRSFELDPSAPSRRDMTMEEALRRKYGMGPEQVATGHARLTEMGAAVGFDFRFERIQLGNTFDAHRMAQAARGTEQEHALIRGLFGAYFTDGRLLSDHEVLRDVARAARLDEVLIDKVLGGELFAREVRLDESMAQELEVTGVPFFLVGGRWPIPGAQDVETLVTVLNRAWARDSAQ
jgi:predicted DsbA family dithiol-disulfide isomerase